MVCLTVIGIIQIIIKTTQSQLLVDDILALANLLFMGATVFSCLSLRARRTAALEKCEQLAEIFFLAGLAVTVLVSVSSFMSCSARRGRKACACACRPPHQPPAGHLPIDHRPLSGRP